MCSSQSVAIPPWLRRVVTAQVFWTLAIIILSSAIFLLSPLDRNYTSGELLDQLNAFQKGEMYSPLKQAPYLIFNYPPLFHGLVSLFQKTGLSLLTAGRLLNLLAFTGCLFVLYQWLRRVETQRFYILFTLGLVGTSYPLLTSLGQIQLQMTAVFFSFSGLFVLNFSKRTGDVLWAGVLLGLACFTKQTQALTALTALLWCLCYQRKAFTFLFLSLLVTGLLGIVILQASYGMEIWHHLLKYTVGTFSFANLTKQFLGHFFPWLILFGFALYGGSKDSGFRKSIAWWYLLATSLGLFSSARIGSSAMYFVEWSWAVLLCLGLLLPPLLQKHSRSIVSLFLIQILLGDFAIAAVLGYDAKQVREQTKVAQSLCPKLPQKPELLISSHPGIIQACGHSMAFYPFITSSLMRQNLWDAFPLLQDIEAGKFTAVLLEFPVDGTLGRVEQERWHPKLLEAVAQSYEPAETLGNFYLYQRKSTTN